MRSSLSYANGYFISDRLFSSVRATNVYEEKTLGIYEDDASIDEENFSLSGNRMSIWGNYLAMHARRQLAFGTRPFYYDNDHEIITAD